MSKKQLFFRTLLFIALLGLPLVGDFLGTPIISRGLYSGLWAQSLWKDHNPYAVGRNLQKGTILKLYIDEPVQVVYQYENLTDENIDISLVPDRNITNFLPPASAKRNISKRYANQTSSRSRMRLNMAVTVSAEPRNAAVSFTGTKFLAQENGISRQQVQVSGRVHVDDIEAGRLVYSQNAADLQIVLIGAPVPKTKNLPLPKQEPEPIPQTTAPQTTAPQTTTPQAEDGTTEGPQTETRPESAALPEKGPPAALSNEQKRQLLWEYINRLLGESTGR